MKVQRRTIFPGFTLVEMLVAMAIFTLLALVVAGLADSTMRVTNLSQQRLTADGDARQALDRLGADLSRAVLRSDLVGKIEKKNGNDRLVFHAQADGYGGARGISTIAYDGEDGHLRRGATGTAWEQTGKQLAFHDATPPDVEDDDYDVAAAEVFRFEMAFLLSDGRIVAETDSLSAGEGTADSDKVRAVIVGMATLESKTRGRLSPAVIEALRDILGDAQDGEDLLQRWNKSLGQSNLPVDAKSAVRFYQRFFLLDHSSL